MVSFRLRENTAGPSTLSAVFPAAGTPMLPLLDPATPEPPGLVVQPPVPRYRRSAVAAGSAVPQPSCCPDQPWNPPAPLVGPGGMRSEECPQPGAARSLMGRSYYPKANAAGLCQGTLETDDRQHAECPVMEPGQPGRATGRDSRPAARGRRRAGARRAAQARRPGAAAAGRRRSISEALVRMAAASRSAALAGRISWSAATAQDAA